MKHAFPSVILVGPDVIARADFLENQHPCRTAPRPVAATMIDSVRAALALGSRGGSVWVLLDDVFTQKVMLTPAQTAGLNPAEIGRALSFEIEPFSGIPVGDAATGFRAGTSGEYDVVEMAAAEVAAIKAAVESFGATLAGITHPGRLPRPGEPLEPWLLEQKEALVAGERPIVLPPPAAPWPHRFLFTGIALEIAAIVLLTIMLAAIALQRRGFEMQNAALASAATELANRRKQAQSLTTDLAALQLEQKYRDEAVARRNSLVALLRVIATTRPSDVVIREIQQESPSTVIVSGLALEADAVDEMSIVLTHSLRETGWIAHSHRKVGKKTLASGGPWDFSVAIVHRESLEDKATHFSQTDTR